MSEPHGKPRNPRLRTNHISQGKFIHSPDRSSCRFAPASDEIRMSRTEKGSGERKHEASFNPLYYSSCKLLLFPRRGLVLAFPLFSALLLESNYRSVGFGIGPSPSLEEKN